MSWQRPSTGLTNDTDQVRHYSIECHTVQNTTTYTAKQSVDNVTYSTIMPIEPITLYSAEYNCCVEAVFEAYSSKSCSSANLSITDIKDESFQTSTPCTTMTEQDELPLIQYIGISGALGLILLMLILLQILICICLGCVYVYKVSPAKTRLQ